MPIVLHPLFVHIPPVLWLIALVCWIGKDRLKLSPQSLKVLVLLAALSALATFGSGLWDEDQAMQALKQGWRINDHRFAGIAATAISLVALGSVLKPPASPQQRWLPVAAISLATLACWVAVWLGHQAVYQGIWQGIR